MAGVKKQILVVDDNSLQRMLVSAMAIDAGVDVDIAENGAQAVFMCGVKEYDYVLMDRDMPDMDGITATEKIRCLNLEKQPTVVAMTVDDDPITVQQFLEAGAQRFLRKPFNRSQFESCLRTRDAEAGLTPVGFQMDLDQIDPVDMDTLRHNLQMEKHNSSGVLGALVRQFLQDSETLMKDIESDIKRNRQDDLRMHVRGLKGISGHMGAGRMYQICEQMEDVYAFRSHKIRRSFLDQLKREFKQVMVAISIAA